MGLCGEDGTRAGNILRALLERGCFDELEVLGTVVSDRVEVAIDYLTDGEYLMPMAADAAVQAGTFALAVARVQVPSQLILYSNRPSDISDFIRDVVRRGKSAEGIRRFGKRAGHVVGLGFVVYDIYDAGQNGADGYQMLG